MLKMTDKTLLDDFANAALVGQIFVDPRPNYWGAQLRQKVPTP
jgi:hypothetical protein